MNDELSCPAYIVTTRCACICSSFRQCTITVLRASIMHRLLRSVQFSSHYCWLVPIRIKWCSSSEPSNKCFVKLRRTEYGVPVVPSCAMHCVTKLLVFQRRLATLNLLLLPFATLSAAASSHSHSTFRPGLARASYPWNRSKATFIRVIRTLAIRPSGLLSIGQQRSAPSSPRIDHDVST